MLLEAVGPKRPQNFVGLTALQYIQTAINSVFMVLPPIRWLVKLFGLTAEMQRDGWKLGGGYWTIEKVLPEPPTL